MLPLEHSAILLTFITFIKLPFVIKILVLSIFEWPLYTGFTVILSSPFICLAEVHRIVPNSGFKIYLGLFLNSDFESNLDFA